MSRVLVVGPGPVRPGVGVGSSSLAREVASALASLGHEIAVVDASPTSALLEPGFTAHRFLEPLTPASVRAVAAASQADVLVAEAMGIFVARSIGSTLDDLPWLGRSPSALYAASRTARAELDAPGGPVFDAVVASDGAGASVLAVFAADTSAGLAPCDATHTFVEPPAPVAAALARVELPRGLFTVRVAAGAIVLAEPLDSSLWGWGAAAVGLGAGRVLARLLDGASVTAATSERGAESVRVRTHLRAPTFDESAPEVAVADRAVARSLGGRVVLSEVAPIPSVPPKDDVVVLLGPAPPRAGHGEEASAATRRAAALARAMGRPVRVITSREDLGRGEDARVLGDSPSSLSGAQMLAVIRDFGSDADASSSDSVAEVDPAAIELHVVTIAGGDVAKVVGTFEHVERGVHASDAAAVFPSLTLPEDALRDAEDAALEVARVAGGRGLVTARFAIVLGASPSRTLLGVTRGVTTHVLSLEHVLGRDLVSEAFAVALGGPVDPEPPPVPRHVAVEEHVFAFAELGAADTKLGRHARSTGTVLGIAKTVGRAYAKALAAMGVDLAPPAEGERSRVLVAGSAGGSALMADLGRRLYALGFELVTTAEAATWLDKLRVPHQLERDPARAIASGRYHAVVAPGEGAELRRAALGARVACFTTVELVEVAVRALEEGTARAPSSLATWNADA